MALIVAPTAQRERFATEVAKGSGLSFAAVLAWMRAENGPSNNFLGVKNPATGVIGTYATPEAGAAATLSVLRQPNMAAILTTAQGSSDPRVQLAAIAASPWQDSQPKKTYLQLLLGSLSSNNYSPPASPATQAAQTVAAANPSKWTGDLTTWVQKESALALAYAVLTLLGLVFVVFGALDTFGYSPARVASSSARRLAPPIPDAIPF